MFFFLLHSNYHELNSLPKDGHFASFSAGYASQQSFIVAMTLIK